MDKAFKDMTLEELKAERDKWQKEIDTASGWGAGVSAALEFRDEANIWISRREREFESN